MTARCSDSPAACARTKENKHMSRTTHLTSLIAVIAAVLMLGASPASAIIIDYFPIAFARGQTARINLLNTSESAIIIDFKFLDGDGSVLGEFGGTIAPGRTSSFDLNRDTLPHPQNRVQLHVKIDIEDARLRDVLSSLEVLNNADGRTTVFVGNPDIKTGAN